MDGDGISTVDSSLSPDILAVESAADEDPVLHSPSLSDDDDNHQLDVVKESQASTMPSFTDIRAKIVKQVEYYFSDENLPNDNFLMKQVRKDKQGFVWISLIASFRKMKKLTKDSSLIIDALKESSQLVLSSDGRKVRRLHPLPLHLLPLHPLPLNENKDPMRCYVVVVNLPEDHSVQNIQKIFGGAGSIKSISINDPHAAEDSVRKKASKLVNGKIYALVEYEAEEAAEKAVATLNDETDWRNGLRVQLLVQRMVGRKARKGSEVEKGSHAQLPVPAKEEHKNHSNEQHDAAADDEQVGEHTSQEKNKWKGRKRSKGKKYHVNHTTVHGNVVGIGEPSRPPPGPRMPDGTRGFTMGRGRPLNLCSRRSPSSSEAPRR